MKNKYGYFKTFCGLASGKMKVIFHRNNSVTDFLHSLQIMSNLISKPAPSTLLFHRTITLPYLSALPL